MGTADRYLRIVYGKLPEDSENMNLLRNLESFFTEYISGPYFNANNRYIKNVVLGDRYLRITCDKEKNIIYIYDEDTGERVSIEPMRPAQEYNLVDFNFGGQRLDTAIIKTIFDKIEPGRELQYYADSILKNIDFTEDVDRFFIEEMPNYKRPTDNEEAANKFFVR